VVHPGRGSSLDPFLNGPDPEPPPPRARRIISHLAEMLTHAPSNTCYNDADILSADTANHLHPLEGAPVQPQTSSLSSPDFIAQHPLQPPPSTCKLNQIRLLQYVAVSSIPFQQTLRLHIDGGANRSVTNQRDHFIKFKNIKMYYMSSAAGDNDIACTGIGYIPWRSQQGQTVLIKCYYSKNAPETIVSPSNIVLGHLSTYHSWTQNADMSTNTGYIKFVNNDTSECIEYPLVNKNNLWYYINDDMTDYYPSGELSTQPIARRIHSSNMYMLMHARLGHPGERVMQDIHNHVEGISKLHKPSLFKCGACVLMNATKRAVTAKDLKKISVNTPEATPLMDIKTQDANNVPMSQPDCQSDLLLGQVFQIDMGFVWSKKYQHRADNGHLVTSIDGYNGYVIVVDRATRYTWLFLTRHKTPQSIYYVASYRHMELGNMF